MLWLRQLLDWQREAQEPGEFLESLRYDLGSQRGLRLHAEGRRDRAARPGPPRSTSRTRCTPRSATAASAPGSTAGWSRWISQLDNGDVVEVFTSKSEHGRPVPGLAVVRRLSPRARTKIRQWFAKERREDAIEAGKDAISRAMRKAGLPLQRLLGGDALTTLAHDLRYADVTALYAAVGEGHVSAPPRWCRSSSPRSAAPRARSRTSPRPRSRPGPGRRRPAGDPGVVVKGASDVWVKLAKCCTPVPGRRDPRLRHPRRRRVACTARTAPTRPTLLAKPERIVEVEWAPSHRLGVPRRDPGRGARPAPAALRRHPGALRRADQHPVRVGRPRPATGSRSAGSPSSSPTPSISVTF